MKEQIFKFKNSSTAIYFAGGIAMLKTLAAPANAIIITDENVHSYHAKKIKNYPCIIIKAGEKYKTQKTVDGIIAKLIALGADRKTTLIGLGGGVVTDVTGYVASIYMRGVKFGFVPTTILAMVDAAIGGKNGVDIGLYKNMVGCFNQPAFILYDLIFLNTLPETEWRSGFAEIIKHAAIKDEAMFKQLQASSITSYKKNKKLLCKIIEANALIKLNVILNDEFEAGERKLLNFGHTLGHAMENTYKLSHGEAISIGMSYASLLSQEVTGFKNATVIIATLNQYGLPTLQKFAVQKVMDILKNDKKKDKEIINYILLAKIGKAVVQPLPVWVIEDFFNTNVQ